MAYRRDIIKIIREELERTDHVPSKARQAIILLNAIEKAGMKPPCLPGDKCQKMLHKYIDPQLNMWEDEFDQKFFNLEKESDNE